MVHLRNGVLGLATFLTACANAGPTEVDDRVHVVSATPISSDATQLVFPRAGNPDLAALVPGDIVVGTAGTGFLRKVVAVDATSDQITLSTASAALSDALIRAQYTSDVSDKPDVTGARLGDFAFDESNVPLLSSGGVAVTLTGAHFSFQPSLDLALSISDSRISEFELVAGGMFDASIALHVGASSQDHVSGSKQIWQSAPKVFTQLIGIVPVVEVVSLTATASWDVSTSAPAGVDVGASTQANVQLGRRYEDGTWSSVGDHTLSVTPTGPTWSGQANVDAQAGLAVELDVSFYDALGPYLTVEPQLTASYKVGSGASAGWGVAGTAGGKIDVLGVDVGNFDANLFNVQCAFGEPLASCL